jgi:PGM1 C-terminal domain
LLLSHLVEARLPKVEYLTDGRYDAGSGLFFTQQEEARYYFATDNLVHPSYRRLTPPDLIDVAIECNLHFDRTTQQGVTFNLIGAVSEHGKLGVLSIAASLAAAEALYRRTVCALDAACS